MSKKQSKNRKTVKVKGKQKQNKIPVIDFKFSDLFTADYLLITAVLILLPLLVYAQVYNFEFVWDDGGESVGGHLSNPFLSDFSWQNFIQLFSEQFFAMYVPVTYLFWGGLKSFAQLLSLPFNSVLHLANVVVHIINGLLVFTLLKQFVPNKWAVLIGTLFFLLHPIQVEVVAWVSEFRSLLAAFFILSSLYIYLKLKEKISYLSLFLFVLAVLSKPSAVVVVPFVFLINHFHYGFKLSKNIAKTLPFAFIALMAVVIAHSVQSSYDLNVLEYGLAFWQRPFAWLDSIIFYLYKIIYPYHLSASYTLSPKYIAAQWWFYPLAILPIMLGYLLWLKRNAQPLIVFASALFIAGFFTTSGFVDFAFQKYSLVADRYLYFAMIGVALLLAAAFSQAQNKVWQGLIIVVLLVFATLSGLRQVPIWHDKHSLWAHSVAYETQPNYAHLNLGASFNNIGFKLSQAGKPEQAIVYFEKAINTYPKNAIEKLSESISNIGVSLIHQKKYQQALEQINQALEIHPKFKWANNLKMYILTLLKQCQKAKQAVNSTAQHKIKLQATTLANLKQKCPN